MRGWSRTTNYFDQQYEDGGARPSNARPLARACCPPPCFVCACTVEDHETPKRRLSSDARAGDGTTNVSSCRFHQFCDCSRHYGALCTLQIKGKKTLESCLSATVSAGSRARGVASTQRVVPRVFHPQQGNARRSSVRAAGSRRNDDTTLPGAEGLPGATLERHEYPGLGVIAQVAST